MPKRKREDVAVVTKNDFVSVEDQAVRIQSSRLQTKLEHGTQVLKDAIQLARGFERQKLSRRQKQAEKQPQTLLRLREEAIVVRQIDTAKVAKDYLFKQLVKTKRIRDSPAFVVLYGNDPTLASAKSEAETNVLGRLFKSNPVKSVLPNIMKDIRDVLGLADVDAERKLPVEGKKSAASVETSEIDQLDLRPELNKREKLLECITLAGISDAEGDDEADKCYPAHNKRMAAPSEDDDADTNNSPAQSESEDNISISLQSDTESMSSRSIDVPNSRPRPQAQKSRPVNEKISNTTFLPTLSMGGYYSGSESGSEVDKYNDGAKISQPRKNRRGQRARRGIAELKYGQNAKHLGSEKQQDRKGPGRVRSVGKSGGNTKFGAKASAFSRTKGPTGANGDAVNVNRHRMRNDDTSVSTAKNSTNTSLHPSWEAARKKKIEKSTASFAGKKITFD